MNVLEGNSCEQVVNNVQPEGLMRIRRRYPANVYLIPSSSVPSQVPKK